MVRVKHTIATFAACLVPATAVIFKPQNEYKALSAEDASFAVNLQPWFNNRAFGLKPNDSSFDGSGSEQITEYFVTYRETNKAVAS